MKGNESVLLVSRDRELLQSRKLIFGAYFHVEAAGRVTEVESLFKSCRFHLIVLCYTLLADECRKIEQLARQQPCEPQVFEVPQPARPIPHDRRKDHTGTAMGQQLVSLSNPLALLRTSAEMLGVRIAGKGRSPSDSREDTQIMGA